MAASDNRSSSSLSMSALVSSAIGLQAGFSTNCRRHALQAYLALPLWICPFRTTRLEPQLGHLGRGCFSLIPPLYNHYPLITIFKFSGPVPQPVGRADFLALQGALIKALPDWKFNAKSFKVQGDKVMFTV